MPPLASACKFKFDNLCAIYTCQANSLLKFVHVLYFLFIINQSKNSISDYNIFTRVLKNNFIPSKIDNYDSKLAALLNIIVFALSCIFFFCYLSH